MHRISGSPQRDRRLLLDDSIEQDYVVGEVVLGCNLLNVDIV